MDSSARTPLTGTLWTAQPAGHLTVVTRSSPDVETSERVRALRDKGADVIEAEPDSHGSASIEAALRELGKRGVLSVLVEGGARVLGACVDAKLADRAHVFIAPKIIGGKESLTAVGGSGIARVADALKFDGAWTARRIGGDMLIEGALTTWG